MNNVPLYVKSIRNNLAQVEFELSLIEANQAKPESATTDCSAAGGDVKRDKTGRSADWQAEALDYFIAFLKKRHADAHGKHKMNMRPEHSTVMTECSISLHMVNEYIEERRRSEERT
jgi:hypothetical protein